MTIKKLVTESIWKSFSINLNNLIANSLLKYPSNCRKRGFIQIFKIKA